MYINQVNLKKAKDLAKDMGLDAKEGLFGKNAEFQNDKRFQALFEK